jgi:hypothetical protein
MSVADVLLGVANLGVTAGVAAYGVFADPPQRSEGDDLFPVSAPPR